MTKLSNLISELTEIYEEFGDLDCVFDRLVCPQVDSKTPIVNIYVSTEHDSYEDQPTKKLILEGI